MRRNLIFRADSHSNRGVATRALLLIVALLNQLETDLVCYGPVKHCEAVARLPRLTQAKTLGHLEFRICMIEMMEGSLTECNQANNPKLNRSISQYNSGLILGPKT